MKSWSLVFRCTRSNLPPDGRPYPHPGEQQTKLLGRSSDSPSSSSGAFPCEIRRTVACCRLRQAYSSGGLCRNVSGCRKRTGSPASRFTRSTVVEQGT